jgi:hypothetical protein
VSIEGLNLCHGKEASMMIAARQTAPRGYRPGPIAGLCSNTQGRLCRTFVRVSMERNTSPQAQ